MESLFSSSLAPSPFPTTPPPRSSFLQPSSLKFEEGKTTPRHCRPRHSSSTISTPTAAVTVKATRSMTPSKGSSLAAIVSNAVNDFINNFIDPPLRPSVDPKHVLSGNFAPVAELPPTECEVIEGSLPPCLDGAYIRNGPNPQFLPTGPYHLLDGDGMLHSIRISRGRATFCSRFVRTNKYLAERAATYPIVPNLFSSLNNIPAAVARGTLYAAQVLTGQFNPANGIGLASTSVALFASRLFALGESDIPYEITLNANGDVETVGRCNFNGKLLVNMTAHPKIDPSTGEVFAFRVSPISPFLTYFRFFSNGTKEADVPIFSLLSPPALHDFAVTKKYAVFTESQFMMNIKLGGPMVRADSRKTPRIGIIPKYTKDESEIRWFEAPGFNIIHAVNAWEEEGGEIIGMVAPNEMSVENTLERIGLAYTVMELVKVDLRTGSVRRQPVSAKNLEFGVINPTRYVYAAIGDPVPKARGVVKLDLAVATEQGECTIACRMYDEGCYGGEPFFVAREPENASATEDDGYLVSYVHDEKTGQSRFLVMDAKSPDLEIVATVKLPQRVPYGFHGLFVREAHLSMR